MGREKETESSITQTNPTPDDTSGIVDSVHQTYGKGVIMKPAFNLLSQDCLGELDLLTGHITDSKTTSDPKCHVVESEDKK